MQNEALDVCRVSQSSRDYYQRVALGAVRASEMELAAFVNTRRGRQYMIVRQTIQHEAKSSVVRDIIGRTAIPYFMGDFVNVIAPHLAKAVDIWKAHCVPFGTADLVTERTVLEQWMEESIQNIAFLAMLSLQQVMGHRSNVHSDEQVQRMFNAFFPKIHEWQLLHARHAEWCALTCAKRYCFIRNPSTFGIGSGGKVKQPPPYFTDGYDSWCNLTNRQRFKIAHPDRRYKDKRGKCRVRKKTTGTKSVDKTGKEPVELPHGKPGNSDDQHPTNESNNRLAAKPKRIRIVDAVKRKAYQLRR
ncbi:hypothetical protein T484DRAFT_1758289, partial [Baffinella frigidus]